MSSLNTIPGLYYTFVRPPAEPSPLRTDVAGIFGRTHRGPAGQAVRVEGWREYMNVFGGLVPDAITPFAVRGYFDNWARTAHVVRVLGEGSQTASATWTVGSLDPVKKKPDADWPGDGGFSSLSFTISATSPGSWANGVSFVVRYWARGAAANPELEIQITPPDEPAEILTGIRPATVVDEVNAKSIYVRLAGNPLPAGVSVNDLKSPAAGAGPRYIEWDDTSLSAGSTLPPTLKEYLDAVTALGDEVEVALVVCPDLFDAALSFPDEQGEIIAALMNQAEALHDRLVILDIPPGKDNVACALQWISDLRDQIQDEKLLRNAAVYHPYLQIADPLGNAASPLRTLPGSGFVTGVISRLDGQLTPYATPANSPIYDCVDLAQLYNAAEQTALYRGGINLLKCSPAKGLLVWGGRVLGLGSASLPGSGTVDDFRGGFVAHRRLIHTLTRAIRRVAEPLVFDTNGPALWLAFVRSITSVLSEAYRAGALKGATPQEAFQVKCDAETNPPENIDNGLCICEILVAPAAPMEFITLRVAVSGDGKLEVFES